MKDVYEPMTPAATMTLRTARLELRPLSPQAIAAQLKRHPSFFKRLSVEPRTDWPPPLYDDDALRWTQERLDRGEDPRWHIRIVTTKRPLIGRARLIGVAGFKGPPDARGEVEIGYSIVASEQRRGFGREAVDALVAFAFAERGVATISALTLDGEETEASRRVLEGAGFAGPEPTEEAGVVRYELVRNFSRKGLRGANHRPEAVD